MCDNKCNIIITLLHGEVQSFIKYLVHISLQFGEITSDIIYFLNTPKLTM